MKMTAQPDADPKVVTGGDVICVENKNYGVFTGFFAFGSNWNVGVTVGHLSRFYASIEGTV